MSDNLNNILSIPLKLGLKIMVYTYLGDHSLLIKLGFIKPYENLKYLYAFYFFIFLLQVNFIQPCSLSLS